MNEQSKIKFTKDLLEEKYTRKKESSPKEKLQTKHYYKKQSVFDKDTGQIKVGLSFEKTQQPKTTNRIIGEESKILPSSFSKEETTDNNVGVEALDTGVHTTKQVAYRMHQTNKRTTKRINSKSLRAKSHNTSTPVDVPKKQSSKQYQHQAIKTSYVTKRKNRSATTSSGTILKKGVTSFVQTVKSVVTNVKVAIPVFFFLFVMILLGSMYQSTSMIFQSAFVSVSTSTYPSSTDDMLIVNEVYMQYQTTLQEEINRIEEEYVGFDEYRYYLDVIVHDPHELTSYLSVLYQSYTLDEVQSELSRLFDLQFQLDIQESIETQESDELAILTVYLKNTSIEQIVSITLDETQLQLYYTYRTTYGNQPLLFGGGSTDSTPSTDLRGVVFVGGERIGNQEIVDIALNQVGNVGGYPYWSWYGFEYRVEWCATYVSWVLNQAGYDEPKFAACQLQGIPYFTANGRWSTSYEDIAPGDIIFFDWEGDGHSDHVGIVIGKDASRVYTVEGNSGDACKIRDYSLYSSVIMGYGLMN